MSALPNDAYWVEPGRFMAGPYPGSPTADRAIEKLKALTEAGVTHFIDLTFPKGESTDHLEPYEHLLEELSGQQRPGYSRHSIVDVGIPSLELMAEILTEIDRLTAAGETVYVHC